MPRRRNRVPHTRINGVNIYFEQHGEAGEPLVLMHGYTGDVTDWRFQLPEFSRTHRVVAMDHRGHGRSEAPNDRASYTISQMADDAQALADFLGLERYHLVGHSMGGAIAQEMALASPGRLLSLTLHDTGYRFDLSRNEMIAKFTAMRNKIAEEQGMVALAAIKSPFPSPPFMPAERELETQERLAAMSVDAFIGAGAGLRAWQGTAERLADIKTRTLVIYGDMDNPMLVEASKHMAKTIPGATLEVVPQAAHSPQYERSDLFNAALRNHIGAGAASPK
jgi:pimeloyl-ACP methyl ester carboxylesterase